MTGVQTCALPICFPVTILGLCATFLGLVVVAVLHCGVFLDALWFATSFALTFWRLFCCLGASLVTYGALPSPYVCLFWFCLGCVETVSTAVFIGSAPVFRDEMIGAVRACSSGCPGCHNASIDRICAPFTAEVGSSSSMRVLHQPFRSQGLARNQQILQQRMFRSRPTKTL